MDSSVWCNSKFKMKIAIFHGGDIFINPIAEDWRSKGHEVRLNPNYSVWPGFEPDMIWFEFCTSNIVAYTNNFVYKHGKAPMVVCRLHGVGARLNIYKSVDWKHVDHLIFINDALRSQCETGTDLSITNVHTIYNGVNLKEFTLKKDFSPTYKIAFVGRPTPMKGANDLGNILARFKVIDSRYELHKAVGQIPHYDMNEWLEDKDYLIHPSKVESFCYSVAESMAKGIRPLIGRWDGAEETWGNEFFLDDFNLEQDPLRMRSIIEEKYNFERTLKEINNIVMS